MSSPFQIDNKSGLAPISRTTSGSPALNNNSGFAALNRLGIDTNEIMQALKLYFIEMINRDQITPLTVNPAAGLQWAMTNPMIAHAESPVQNPARACNCNSSNFPKSSNDPSHLRGLGPVGGHNPEMPPLAYHDALHFRQAMHPLTLFKQFGSRDESPAGLESPHGACFGKNGEVVIADTGNHQIKVFSVSGQLVMMFGQPGQSPGRLWYPRKVLVSHKSGNLVVCDRGRCRSRLQVFDWKGKPLHFMDIAYVHIVAGMSQTADGIIVIIDSVKPTVFFVDPEKNVLVKHFGCADYIVEPSDIAVSKDGFSFVTDFKGHCVTIFNPEGRLMRKISTCNVPGIRGCVTLYPNGIDISEDGDLIIGDSHGNSFHAAIFNRFGKFLSQYSFPELKVSRCCGVKVSPVGQILTAAKNNHAILMFDPMYIYDV